MESARTIFLYAFLIVTVVTCFGVLLANLGAFGEDVRKSDFATKWGTGVVLGQIVSLTGLAFKRDIFSPKNYLITFQFGHTNPLDPQSLVLCECTYEIINPSKPSKPISRGSLLPVPELSGEWGCNVPFIELHPDYIIKVSAKDSIGRIWTARSFHPLSKRIEVEAS